MRVEKVDLTQLLVDIQYNCDISDARDHGIYSMCSMVLKLRNLYKWQHGLQPWHEPETADLLDWIESQENYWQELQAHEFRPLVISYRDCAVHDVVAVNRGLDGSGLFYGAGLGRSLKAIFFLGEITATSELAGYPVVMLGKERAREMASPFAMVQDDTIILRRDSLRFFLWDHIQEMRGSGRSSYRYFLGSYGLLDNGELSQERLRTTFEELVEGELDLFLYHELGELRQREFGRTALQPLVGHFQGSVIEFVSRAVKDILADTDPKGLLTYLVEQEKASSMALYVTFQDGLRERLFPELRCSWQRFAEDGDWRPLAVAISHCRAKTEAIAESIVAIGTKLGSLSDKELVSAFNHTVLAPLGLDQVQV